MESLSDIKSVDELAANLDHSLEEGGEEIISIGPEVEFWAHCSNLQVWAENNYDTRMLHSNIAFPLLKALADAGDSLAKLKFKEEIIKRIKSGYQPVINYLIQEYIIYLVEGEEIYYEYFLFLDLDEFEMLLDDLDDGVKDQIRKVLYLKITRPDSNCEIKDKCYKFLEKLEKDINLEFVEVFGEKFYMVNGKLSIYKNTKRLIENMENIKGLDELIQLRELDLSNNKIKRITNLEKLRNLEVLRLRNNKIENLSGLSNLDNLKKLILSRNRISKIIGLDSLVKLEYLNLSQNEIKEIEGLNNLKNLKRLFLGNNQITEIKGIDNLDNLEHVILHFNEIEEIKGLKTLTNLLYLSLTGNTIRKINIDELKNIKEINLLHNPFSQEQIEIIRKRNNKKKKILY